MNAWRLFDWPLLKKADHLVLDQISDSLDSLIFSALRIDHATLIVTPEGRSAERVAQELESFGMEVLLLPPRELLTHRVFSQSRELLLSRAALLSRIAREDFHQVVVCSVRAASQQQLKGTLFRDLEETLLLGMERSLESLITKLGDLGYERQISVSNPGEFALRGDILDLWLPGEELPVRIEFFGNEIDGIRSFHPETQRSVSQQQELRLIPAMESVDHPAFSDKMEEIQKQIDASPEFLRERDRYYSLLGASESLIRFGNFQSIWFFDEEQCMERLCHLHEEYAFRVSEAMQQGEALPGEEKNVLTPEEFSREIRTLSQVRLKRFYSSEAAWHAESRPQERYQGDLGRFLKDLEARKREGYRQLILPGEHPETLLDELKEAGIPVTYGEGVIARGEVRLMEGSLGRGFVMESEGAALYVRRDLFSGKKKRKKSRFGEHSRRIDDYFDLKQGDLVVHVHHGIARYQGVVKKTVEGVARDYLCLEYAAGDQLFVPTEHVDFVQRYIGGSADSARLSRLGGQDWHRKREKVKKSIEDMTEELLELYARREQEEGFAFSPDSPWQRQFEMDFEHEETKDQLRVIQEIKEDMESRRPMDRLLCGDVGFGKTEVALRAVFKAVMDSKQAVILAPTTILAQQHYGRMKERFADYPMSIAMLSRLTRPGERKKILEKLKSGELDIVVGTHMLLSQTVQYRDLGLLVIDEEQRFGVRHKENIRALKTHVDTLAMSATPIPRSLNLSLSGIRDMSLLQEPPHDRYPIQTYITAFDERLVREAVLRELERGGQIYYVYNRVEGLPTRCEALRKLLPGVRIDYAHGQMNERQLEERIMDFVEGELDLLLCTTIVETGMDIPNVNTILIENAQNLGLAQLYQLRGRVGRSDRVAYAWLFFPPHLNLQPQAMDRLETIREFTDFGSGFRIALRDLEIRGSGSVLGSRQSGHFEEVGYELYMQLLAEHMETLRGNVKPKETEVNLDLELSAHLPDDYIGDTGTKMEIYQKIRRLREKEEIEEMEDELLDRFGEIPEEVTHLLWIARMRHVAGLLGFREIQSRSDHFRLEFDGENFPSGHLISRISRELPQCQMQLRNRPRFWLNYRHTPLERSEDVRELLELLEEIYLFKEEERVYNDPEQEVR